MKESSERRVNTSTYQSTNDVAGRTAELVDMRLLDTAQRQRAEMLRMSPRQSALTDNAAMMDRSPRQLAMRNLAGLTRNGFGRLFSPLHAGSSESLPLQRQRYDYSEVATRLPQPVIRYQTATLNGMTVPLRVEAKGLHLADGTTGTSTFPQTDAVAHSNMFNTVRNGRDFRRHIPGGVDLYDLYGGDKTHDAHLLTERLHGQARVENLSLVPKEVNMALRGIEWYTEMGALTRNSQGEVFDWEAAVNYGRSNMPTPFENTFPTSIEVRATPQQLTGDNTWVDDLAHSPYYRNVTVNVNRQAIAQAAPGVLAPGLRFSPFSPEQRSNRSQRAQFIRDAFVREQVGAYRRGLLAQHNSDAILSPTTVNPDFVQWTRANVRAFLSDGLLTQHRDGLIAILQRHLTEMEIDDALRTQRQLQIAGLANNGDFDIAAIRQRAEEHFFTSAYRSNGGFPQASIDEGFFWVERTLEGIEESWYEEMHGPVEMEY